MLTLSGNNIFTFNEMLEQITTKLVIYLHELSCLFLLLNG